jgi:hypothetical protein
MHAHSYTYIIASYWLASLTALLHYHVCVCLCVNCYQGIGDVPDLKWKHELRIMCGWWALALLIFLPGTIINAVDECNSIKGLCIGEHTSAVPQLNMQ